MFQSWHLFPSKGIKPQPQTIAWTERFLPIAGLFLTSSVAITLLVLRKTQWRSSEEFAEFVATERTKVAIIVQVLSYLLGLVQAQILCSVVRLSFGAQASSRSFSLDLAQFIGSASTPRFSGSLPVGQALLLYAFLVFSIAPAAIWSAALTPITAARVTTETIYIPSFNNNNFSALFEGDVPPTSGSSPLGQWSTDRGLFSFDPAALRGLILSSGSVASSTNGSKPLHQKLDKTGFFYVGRSYGAGSAAGLIDIPAVSQPQAYNYTEAGFLADVTCIRNTSSAYFIESLPVGSGWQLVIYQAGGSYPGGQTTGGWIYTGYDSVDIFSWGAIYDNETSLSYVPMTTPAKASRDPWAFSAFNATQCRIAFGARNFQVSVNATSRSINVSPTNEIPRWPDYGHTVLDRVTNWIWAMSYLDGSIGGSQLGRSIRLNVNSLQNMTGGHGDEILMQGIADYITSLTDNIMVILASTELVAANRTTSVQASVTARAVVYGNLGFIYASLAVTIVICAIYVAEAVRTRAWRDALNMDFGDIRHIVTAVLNGASVENTGSDMSYKSVLRTVAKAAKTGDGVEEKTLGKMRFRLRPDGYGVLPVLVPAVQDDDFDAHGTNAQEDLLLRFPSTK